MVVEMNAAQQKEFDKHVEAISKLNRKFKMYMDATNTDIDNKSGTYDMFKIRLDTIEPIKVKMDEEAEKFEKLLNKVEHEQRANFIKQFDSFDAQYVDLCSVIKRVLRKQEEAREDSIRAEQQPLQATRLGVKVKPIEPPEFDGTVDKWIPYRDVFETLINTNKALDNVQKFHYLRQSIKIPAGQPNILDSFAFSADNYAAAWAAIRKRYDDKRKIVSSHLIALHQVKKMTTCSALELRKLIDAYTANLSALEQQDLRMDDNGLINAFIVQMVTYRLDDETLRDWRKFHKEDTATWCQLHDFLEALQRSLDDKQLMKKIVAKPMIPKPKSAKAFTASSGATSSPSSEASSTMNRICVLCSESHSLYGCQRFINLSVNDRFKLVKDNNLCLNCLAKGHTAQQCKSKYACRSCNKRHNTLLHFENRNSASSGSFNRAQGSSESAAQAAAHSSNEDSIPEDFRPHTATKKSKDQGASIVPASEQSSHVIASTSTAKSQHMTRQKRVMMSTIQLEVADSNGDFHKCRALLDNGSEGNFILNKLAKKLELPFIKYQSMLYGICKQGTPIKHRTVATIRSCHGDYRKEVDFAILDQITSNIPSTSFDKRNVNIPDNYLLADPTFNEARPVEMLLGAEIFYDCLLDRTIRLPDGPSLVDTMFGWIVAGVIHLPASPSSNSLLASFSTKQMKFLQQMDEKLDKFIESEDIPSLDPVLTPEEQYCENLFVTTTKRHNNGKFIVRMPRKESVQQLGNNKHNALKMLCIQEARRKKDPTIHKLYVDYMEDYLQSGDMTEVAPNDSASTHYLPHHGVVKMSSSSTKLRPVFNASSISETGITLNDTLCVGPTIQPETLDILMRFREKRYAFIGDISRMYRQVLIEPTQRDLLRILWRSDVNEPIKHYQLNTVTFGTSCAPFLATRAVKQIAIEYEETFPVAARTLQNSVYVDDVLGGNDSLEKGQREVLQIRYVLSKAGMKLCKFVANDPALLKGIPARDIEQVQGSEVIIKALGIKYDALSDEFSYQLKPMDLNNVITRSNVLSELFGIYDPMGWIGPVVLKAKVFMKKLCLMKLKWDEELPEADQREWNEFRSTVTAVNNLKIPRHCIIDKHKSIELHGFCDASIAAYGAVIYALSFDSKGFSKVSMLIAKSKVAPTNQKTLARLELCAATLLAKLIFRTTRTLSATIRSVTLWSDSTIVLSWLTISPNKLTTFVGNRVSIINELTHQHTWKHIRGNDNPADIISRGLNPEEIQDSLLWWEGPSFFKLAKAQWPEPCMSINAEDPDVIAEIKKTFVVREPENLFSFVENRFSRLNILINVIANVHRYLSMQLKTPPATLQGPFTADELEKSEICIIRIVQRNLFPEEYKFLYKQHRATADQREKFVQVTKTSPLLLLSPFMDHDAIIRVGGRLENCKAISYNQKHPILLPQCNFTTILVRHLHKKHLHPGATALLSIVREKYWPLRAKLTIKKIIRECLICFRAKPRFVEQYMSDLPPARVTMTTPFLSTAIDYAGFYTYKSGTTRSAPISKCYIALFKCMATGAIHLELVSDLSTAACIAAFTRFTSRRGKPYEIFSDNATCFEGTDNELRKILLDKDEEMSQFCSEQSIRWNFTTPRAPHAGGIYEAGIKSMKHHLKRILISNMTFEHFQTVLCKVEAILNSRPITPMSDDPNDLEVLTPGHFLIGRSLVSMPERNFTFIPSNRLKMFEQLQQQAQKFWTQWYRDYLHTLQTRPLKFRSKFEFNVGELVLLVDKNLPPMKWLMGRIIQVYPSKRDKIVRNVKVLTQHGTKDRDVRYLCFLPIETIPSNQQVLTTSSFQVAGGCLALID